MSTHIHVGKKKAKRLEREENQRWVEWARQKNDPREEPKRVHLQGWPNRPEIERPERGRNSQEPNKKPRGPRRLTKNGGDLLSLGDLKNVHLHKWSETFLEIHSPGACYGSSRCTLAPEGPYIYIGREVFASNVSGEEETWHRLMLGDLIVDCDSAIMDGM